MTATSQSNPLLTLGQRLRQARLERGLTQQALAHPEFSKNYVSALERGSARPSLKALEVLARRLDIPMSDLLTIPPVLSDEPDIAAIEEDLDYQLDTAKVLLNTQQGDEALRLLHSTAQDAAPYSAQLSVKFRYRLHRLRGIAYLRVFEPASARQDLDTAMSLAQQLGDDQEVERVRNAIGAAYYEQDMPREALAQHEQCRTAIHAGLVKDLNLRLSIYSNLANDCWAINAMDQAISTYHEALKLLSDVNNLERQAGIYWGLSLAHKAEGDLDRAKLYAARALPIYEAAHNWEAAAQMNHNLAEILIQRKEYTEAEASLERAKAILEGTQKPLLLSVQYEHYAELELGRGQLAKAAEYAKRSLQLSEEIFQAQSKGEEMTRANITRTYARALRVAGLVEERMGQPEAADTLFERAIEVLVPTGYAETAHEVEFAYAELLDARGEYQRASEHFRVSALLRHHRTQ